MKAQQPDKPTMVIPIQSFQNAIGKRIILSFLIVAIIAAAAGFVVGDGYGSNKAVKPSTASGWILTSATINGKSFYSDQTVYISWDIAKNPHDLGASWYIIIPAPKGTILEHISVNIASDGQGNITLVSYAVAGSGLTTMYGTYVNNVLQITVTPDSRLFPAAPKNFVMLTFKPSTPATFNQLVSAGGV